MNIFTLQEFILILSYIVTVVVFVMSIKNKISLVNQELKLQERYFNTIIEQMCTQITLLNEKIDIIDKNIEDLKISFARLPKGKNDR